jgi:SRSO17 transposase
LVGLKLLAGREERRLNAIEICSRRCQPFVDFSRLDRDKAVANTGCQEKYYLANLPAKTDLRTLAATIKARWICEQAHQQMKEELGLDHFEGRSWQGLHRHALMTMIAYAFLQHRRLTTARRKKKNQRAAASANFARRTPRHPRTLRSTTAAAMPALSKMDLQRAAA